MLRAILHRKAASEMGSLPKADRRGIPEAFRQMESDPFLGDVRPIKGMKAVFRRRIGNYRVTFTVSFEVREVVILKVGKRGKFYR